MLSIGLCNCIFGQSLVPQWETVLDDYDEQRLSDMSLLSNGQVAVVGEVLQQKQTLGLFLLIDPATGAISQKITFNPPGENASLHSITAALDGSFYIVGSVFGKNEKNSYPWLFQLDEKGEKIWEKQFDASYGQFTDICWLDSNRAILSATRHKGPDGEVSLYLLKDYDLIDQLRLGNGRIRELRGMEVRNTNSVWLSGNTQSSDFSKKGDIWISIVKAGEIDRLTEESFLILGDDEEQSVNSITSNSFGQLLISGETKSGTLGDKDGWLIEQDGRQVIADEQIKNRLENFISASVYSNRNESYSLQRLQRNYSKSIPQELEVVSLKNNYEGQVQWPFSDSKDFEDVRMVASFDGNIIVAGNNLENNHLQFLALNLPSTTSVTSAKRLSSSIPTPAPVFRLADKNKDGCLSPGERGYIELEITNNSPGIILEGKVTVKGTEIVKGLSFTSPKQYVLPIDSGKSDIISIPVVGQNNLEEGLSKGMILLELAGQPDMEVPFEIPSIVCNVDNYSSTVMIFNKPDIYSIGSRTTRTDKDYYEIEMTISSNRPRKLSDFKIFKNGVLLKDEKNLSRNLSPSSREMGNYIYKLNYQLFLDEGKNKVEVDLDGERIEPITIEFVNNELNKPNLHLLAIGPEYTDLQYSSKDARDFARIIAQQQQLGFFNEIFIDTLLTKESTALSRIKVGFSKLKSRAEERLQSPNRIKRNDYLFVFFSGHGTEVKDKLMLLPSDYDKEFIEDTAIDYQEIIEDYLNQIQCKKIIFLDACLSGKSIGTKFVAPYGISEAIERANNLAEGTIVFTSSSGNQLSYENEKIENGLFTEAIIEFLTATSTQAPEAKKEGQIITVEDLEQHLKNRVPNLLKELNLQQKQSPSVLYKDPAFKKLPLFVH
jgi:hypothetical protein